MLDTRISSRCCACYMASPGGHVWLHRCRRWSAAVWCIQHEGSHAKAPVHLIIVTTPFGVATCWSLPALRPWWSWVNPQMWWTSWSFVTMLWSTLWCMWPLIKLQKPVAKFLWQGYISIFRVLAKLLSDQLWKQHDQRTFASLWAYGRLEIHLSMLKPMDR